MEECYHYELVGIQSQGRRNEQRSQLQGRSIQMYMAPNVTLYDKENEYEPLQINTPPASVKQSPTVWSPSGQQAHDQNSTGVIITDDLVKKKRGCIAVCIFFTTFGVFVFIALAIGALGLRGSSNAQLAIAKQSQDYTHLMEEISALKSVLSQLNLETKRNISRLSTSVYIASSSISRLSNSVYTASSRVYWNSYSFSSSASRLSKSLYTASSRANWNSYSVSRLSTSFARCTSC